MASADVAVTAFGTKSAHPDAPSGHGRGLTPVMSGRDEERAEVVTVP